MRPMLAGLLSVPGTQCMAIAKHASILEGKSLHWAASPEPYWQLPRLPRALQNQERSQELNHLDSKFSLLQHVW